MQYVSVEWSDELLTIPDPEAEVLPGIAWGSTADYFSPAFWKAFAWKQQGHYAPRRIGSSLREEVAACMLTGYGIKSEVGVAAFHRLKEWNLLAGDASSADIEAALAAPLALNGRNVRYRFFRAKARAVAAAMAAFDSAQPNKKAGVLNIREALMSLPGVGPKTASYAVRNFYGSDAVAVLDIHIVRASKMIALFPNNADPQRQYLALEDLFLQFAAAIGVRASVLDNLMWDAMRTLEPTTRSA